MAHILVVDDEKNYGAILTRILEDQGHRVCAETNPFAALDVIRRENLALILSDLKMPGMDGTELLQRARAEGVETPFIILTAYATVESALQAMKGGAFDYLMKPFRNEELLATVDKALNFWRLQSENAALRRQLAGTQSRDFIGDSPAIRNLLATIGRVGPVRTSVLIVGETGSGKELVARALHQASPRAKRPIVSVNCAAFAENLLESELFGHERGAFTGAGERKRGLLEVADGGTLFLDEIGEFPPALQPKLLRVLQDRRFRRVGGTAEIECDVRIIAATHRDLAQMIAAGTFREDLFYRLNVVTLDVPALRERRGDIPLLAMHFLQRFARELGRAVRTIAPETLRTMQDYPWPGNVRELQNVIERGVLFCSGETLERADLPTSLHEGGDTALPAAGLSPPLDAPLPEVMDRIEADLIRKALVQTKGVQAQAAEILGISRSNLQYKLKKHKLA